MHISLFHISGGGSRRSLTGDRLYSSFGAGILPLAIALSPSQLRLISTVGMGVLVGTSLIVIIPEGIDTIYSAEAAAAMALRKPGAAVLRTREIVAENFWERGDRMKREGIHVRRDADTVEGHTAEKEHKEDDGPHKESTETAHKMVGLSLISGFILMYLIDVVPSHAVSHAPQTYHIEIDNLRALSASSPPLDSPSGALTHSKASSTTLGLVIHAAADGIALGASSTSSNAALEAIVFLAIMLHKAPAAFGLSAVLLRAGLGKRQARAHLIVFSLAAPLGAIVTWILLNLLGSGGAGGEGIQWWTGVLLLFSGGTFL